MGNTLSYLHAEAECAAAIATMAAHSRPGTVAIVNTLMGAGRGSYSATQVLTRSGRAQVESRSSWDPQTRIQATMRNWRFDDDRVEHDLLQRRFLTHDELTDHLNSAGFEPLSTDAAGARSGDVVAHFLG